LGDVYPNPSKNEVVNIDYRSLENKEMNIQITDMTGRLIMQQQEMMSTGNHNLELDLTKLERGMYLIQFR
jgi:hypothetical protein